VPKAPEGAVNVAEIVLSAQLSAEAEMLDRLQPPLELVHTCTVPVEPKLAPLIWMDVDWPA
jgi:hypothetical protein